MRIFRLAALVLVLTACAPPFVSSPYQGNAGLRTRAEPFPEPSQFSYRNLAESLQISELPWEETAQYKVFHIETSWIMSGEEKKSSLEFKYYRRKLPGEEKTIIVLPIYSRKPLNELLPLFLVSWLTVWNIEADFNVIFVKSNIDEHDPFNLDSLAEVDSGEKTIEWIKESVRRFQRIVTGLRTVLDWAESEKSIDKKRIGLVGFSTSAPIAAVTAGIDPRIAGSAFYAGGISFQDVLAEASEPRVKRIREIVKKERGPWKNFLRTATAIYEPVSPLRYARNLNPAKTLYFDAEFDEYVPKRVREKFWEASGKPERITFSSGHRESFLALTPLDWFSADQKIIDFFRKRL